MDKELAKELKVSLKLLKRVVDESEDPANIQKSLANYTAFVQIELVVNNYLGLIDMVNTKEQNSGRM
jgi:hypothetical protein|tara:strand:+ start:932 stop:1132 length:201 start_codon:yes stop_codon:yes gene_type:complete